MQWEPPLHHDELPLIQGSHSISFVHRNREESKFLALLTLAVCRTRIMYELRIGLSRRVSVAQW